MNIFGSNLLNISCAARQCLTHFNGYASIDALVWSILLTALPSLLKVSETRLAAGVLQFNIKFSSFLTSNQHQI